MIRILHKVHRMDAGGIQSFIMNIYRNIDRKKVQFDFLISETDIPGDYDDEIISLGGRIYQVPNRRNGVLKSIRGINSFFREHSEYKILHAHLSSLTDVSALRIAKKYGISCRIVHSHNTRQGGGKIHEYIHILNQLTLKSYATDFFACSDLAAQWMYPNKLYKNHEFSVINNGIDTEKFTFNENVRNQKRKELGIANKFVIGHVGRFHPQKNHDFLLDIFKEIHNRNNDSVLLLVGDGGLKAYIKQKIEDLGLTKSIIFTGVRSDVAELFQAMDVFVFPSHYEGLGIVLIEAQASGLKCFTSSNVVPRDVDVTGLVKFIDLNKSAQSWSEEIMINRGYTRDITSKIIKESGYDIRQVAEGIQNCYVSKKNKM